MKKDQRLKTDDLSILGRVTITDPKTKKRTEIVALINQSLLSTMCGVMVEMGASRIDLSNGLIVLHALELPE